MEGIILEQCGICYYVMLGLAIIEDGGWLGQYNCLSYIKTFF